MRRWGDAAVAGGHRGLAPAGAPPSDPASSTLPLVSK
jgi:hypothetical protein